MRRRLRALPLRRFGQDDHIRVYGEDFFGRLQESGFVPTIIDMGPPRRMTAATRRPVELLGLSSAILFAGLLAWSNTSHVPCDDSGESVVRGMVLFARWGGLAAGALALAAAWIASRRARKRPPSALLRLVCIATFAAALVACADPGARPVPIAVILVPATLAVLPWLLPALVILLLMLVAARFVPADQRRLRNVQMVALWFAFVLVPGCAGVGLISQFPVCLG